MASLMQSYILIRVRRECVSQNGASEDHSSMVIS